MLEHPINTHSPQLISQLIPAEALSNQDPKMKIQPLLLLAALATANPLLEKRCNSAGQCCEGGPSFARICDHCCDSRSCLGATVFSPGVCVSG
ncbi:hypothetical protein CDD80_5006 [Ophiocordyceps camponoti-rufipedis]|uniref:Uncharacterized protein n=1 Tax=Ophiocordyceps camponoti-rufipedis TaxID=2004952 RepID=A0A2C5YVV8_9HYPO|nr:hypothetical protein CDD80_5006 [Ophiocordyceps camponoti-rufipedis]